MHSGVADKWGVGFAVSVDWGVEFVGEVCVESGAGGGEVSVFGVIEDVDVDCGSVVAGVEPDASAVYVEFEGVVSVVEFATVLDFVGVLGESGLDFLEFCISGFHTIVLVAMGVKGGGFCRFSECFCIRYSFVCGLPCLLYVER